MQTKIQVYLFCTFLAKDLHNIVLFCYFAGIFKHYNTNYRENVPSLPDCSNHPAARLHRRYRHLCPLRLQGGNGSKLPAEARGLFRIRQAASTGAHQLSNPEYRLSAPQCPRSLHLLCPHQRSDCRIPAGSGMYIYTLFVDGKVSVTRRMIVSEV